MINIYDYGTPENALKKSKKAEAKGGMNPQYFEMTFSGPDGREFRAKGSNQAENTLYMIIYAGRFIVASIFDRDKKEEAFGNLRMLGVFRFN